MTLFKLAAEVTIFKNLDREAETALCRSARLLSTKLRPVTGLRLLAGFIGGVALPFVASANASSLGLASTALVLCLIAEFLERWLFFTAVAPMKMPGNN